MKATGAVLLCAFLLPALVVSCGKGAAAEKAASGAGMYNGKSLESIPIVATFSYPHDFLITTTRAELIRKWGKPDSVVSENVASAYNKNTTDERYKLEYKGFFFLLYYSKAKDQELLVATTITSPDYAVSDGLRVGMYKSVMLAKLGQPTFVEKDTFVYAAGLSSTDHMNKELVMSGDTVSRIVIYPEIP
ncbi:MAG TPA: hypothetical protein VMW73_15735 [Spirochaetia bacterium]|nr:hypothetical protein [Spirochaetia bacterium]